MCCDEFADTPVYPWKINVMQTKKVRFIKRIEKPLTFRLIELFSKNRRRKTGEEMSIFFTTYKAISSCASRRLYIKGPSLRPCTQAAKTNPSAWVTVATGLP